MTYSIPSVAPSSIRPLLRKIVGKITNYETTWQGEWKGQHRALWRWSRQPCRSTSHPGKDGKDDWAHDEYHKSQLLPWRVICRASSRRRRCRWPTATETENRSNIKRRFIELFDVWSFQESFVKSCKRHRSNLWIAKIVDSLTVLKSQNCQTVKNKIVTTHFCACVGLPES